MTENRDRSAVRRFYNFSSSWHAFVPAYALGYAIITAIAFAAGFAVGWLLLFGASVAYVAYDFERERMSRRFGELATQTRQIQASDALDALLRVFGRTQLRLDELRTLNEVYQFDKERDLFREEPIQERLHELYNKSIRMWSRGTKSALQVRQVNWTDGNTELFYNPVRVVALFLSTDAVVICDSEVDSAHFGLSENISRVMVEDIVTIGFKAKDEKFNLADDQIMSLAKELSFSAAEQRQLREELEHRATRDPTFLQQEISATLTISQKDGSALEFPIFNGRYLYRPGEVPQRSSNSERSRDELTVDRMVNELKRVVTSAKQRHIA